MALPKYVKLANCVPDPHRRPNHIYHERTDEVFHVDADTAAKVADLQPETAEEAEIEADELGDGDPKAEDELEGESGPSFEDLQRMVIDLGIDLPEGADKAALTEIIEKAVLGEAEKPKKGKK